MKSLDDMKSIVWFIVLCSSLFGNQKVYSQAGELDPTFGTGGKVSVDFSNDRDEAFTIKVQNDQKLVIAGLSKESGNNDFSLTRLNPDGSMDNSFGENGKVVHSLGQYSDFISDIGFQSDGKIIAIGNSNMINAASEVTSVIAVCRYNIDGTLDNTFGNNGKVTYDLSRAYNIANAGYIQSDDKIIVVGYTGLNGSRNFFVVRLNPDGSLDNSFGVGGQKVIDFGGFDYEAKSVSVSNDGKIYAAGYSLDNNTFRSEIAICCLNSDGSFHSNFANNGELILSLGGIGSEASGIGITSSNEIIVSGYNATAAADNFALVKLSSSGKLMNSFGGTGIVFTNLGSNSSQSRSMVIQPDDKIIVSGYNVPNNSIQADFATVRYNSDGSIDEKFGNKGIAITDFFGSDDMLNAVVLQQDGKVVVAGYVFNGTSNDFGIARYLTDVELTVSNDTIVCLGYLGDLTLEASDGFPSYQWVDSLHPSVELGNEKTLTIKPLETTTYGVISGTDTAYCKVTVDNLPIKAQFSMNETEGNVAFRPIIINESVGGELYSWDFGNTTKIAVSDAEDLDIQRKYYPIYDYTGEFNIRLDVVRSSGCKDSAFAQVQVNIGGYQINPTAFTPNGDELNDTFNFKVRSAAKIEGSIYNRWGQKIYSMKANSNVFYWDGSQNGLASPMGYYIYSLKSSDIRGEIKTITGRVLLVR
jgi:uncharacterized delta-60 repeat protein/gliding motility-associated-like protein